MSILDKVFKAYDIRGIYGEEITEDLAWKVGHATGQFLRSLLSGYERGQAASNRIVLGRDMRPHSDSLAEALIEGVTASGTGVVDIGQCDTPMVYFAINHLGTCGGIQITASHNPMEYNGFKISGAGARPIGQNTGLKEIRHIVSTLRRMPSSASIASEVVRQDLWDDYRGHVMKFFRPARRIKVAADASNGMGGKMMPQVFGDAAVDLVPLNFEIGKGFSHPPNPLVEANLKQLKSAVKKKSVEMGICLDGDADRCMFVDENGQIVGCDLLTALLARYFLRDNPGSMVVYDLRSSRVVPEEIRAAGGVPRRERVGHAFMKKAMADGHGVFGGELSGHFYFRDNYNCDSGAIAFATAVTVLAEQNRPFSEIMAPMRRYCQSGEINFEVEDKDAMMKQIAEKFSGAEVDWLDGVTLQFEDWWCNVRPSNTEPLLRLNLEAKDEQLLKEKLQAVKELLGEPVEH